jgi:hypothetical protein
VISYVVESNLNSIKALKLIKLLRPLRVLQVNQNLKIAVSTLYMALEEIFQVILVLIMFLFVFGIVCVNFYKGSFYKCIPPSD